VSNLIRYTMVDRVYDRSSVAAKILAQLAGDPTKSSNASLGKAIISLVTGQGSGLGDSLSLIFILGLMIYFMLWSVWAAEAVAEDIAGMASSGGKWPPDF